MYDVIVIGTGGIGSAALYELARRGVKVLGLDRFPPGHDRGSSHGQTRIIRRSYFEHSNYVPLLNIAYELWDDLCEVSGNDLFQRTGLVYVGAKDNPVIEGVVRSSQDHQVKLESLSAADVAQRFPGYSAPEGATVLLEPDAGYLRVESAVRTSIDEAQKLGAESLHDIEVVGWKPNGTGVIVETTTGRFEAKKLVVTAGCWANSFLLDLNITLQVVRKHLHWYATNDHRYEQSSGCPCFFYGVSNGYFYGFPETANQGLKVAEHSGGTDIDDPLTDDRNPDQTDTARIEQFLSSHLPGVSNRRLDHEVCFYTMTPDAHFIIDRHPSYPQVTFAAGMSGHGFKFAPAIGRLLTELTLDGRPSVDVEFLGLGRPGLLS